jgi:hypothetical protein
MEEAQAALEHRQTRMTPGKVVLTVNLFNRDQIERVFP